MSGRNIFSVIFLVFLASPARAQWTEPVRISHGMGLDTPRATANGDTLFVVGRADMVYFIKSTDGGISWSDPIAPADSFFGGSTMPDIEFSDSLLHLIWIGELPTGRFQVFHFSSGDGGVTWGERHLVFYNNTPYLMYPRITAIGGDTLFITCAVLGQLVVYVSFDAGVTWEGGAADNFAGNVSSWPAILYTGGRIHVIYEVYDNEFPYGFEIYTCYSDNYGSSWSERIPLSTLEPIPDYRHSLRPSAYADSTGNIIVLWFDYKYGSECGFTGDILGRVSTNNGTSWNPEIRLTFTQTGSLSNCLILNDKLYAIWLDDLPEGCFNHKVVFSESWDWGLSWSEPSVINESIELQEFAPVLFYSVNSEETTFHCVMAGDAHGDVRDLYYLGYDLMTSIIDEIDAKIPNAPFLSAFPNPFNSTITITYKLMEGGEIGIYNITGQKIKTIATMTKEGKVIWDARNSLGELVSSGIYFARIEMQQSLEARELDNTVKLIYMK